MGRRSVGGQINGRNSLKINVGGVNNENKSKSGKRANKQTNKHKKNI
jgi:hypothetical protein